MRFPLFILVATLSACGDGQAAEPTIPVSCPGDGDYEYADVIVDAPGEVSSPYAINDPQRAIDGVVDGQPKSGGLEVFSRGYSTDPPNHYVVLRCSDRLIRNVDGPDIIVFENAFETNGGVFMDPIVVSVSSDGENWVEFPHDYVAPDETVYSRDPDHWRGFAGVHPVRWSTDVDSCQNPAEQAAGGDRFDLADLPTVPEPVRYVRLVAAPTVVNPDTGETYPRDVLSDGFDLDGVYVVSTEFE